MTQKRAVRHDDLGCEHVFYPHLVDRNSGSYPSIHYKCGLVCKPRDTAFDVP